MIIFLPFFYAFFSYLICEYQLVQQFGSVTIQNAFCEFESGEKTGPGRKTKMKNNPTSRKKSEGYHKNTRTYISLAEYEETAIEHLQANLDSAFAVLRESHSLTRDDMVNLLSPYIKSPETVSKICAVAGEDKRHCNLEIMAALHYVFGISIDEILDQACKPREKFWERCEE